MSNAPHPRCRRDRAAAGSTSSSSTPAAGAFSIASGCADLNFRPVNNCKEPGLDRERRGLFTARNGTASPRELNHSFGSSKHFLKRGLIDKRHTVVVWSCRMWAGSGRVAFGPERAPTSTVGWLQAGFPGIAYRLAHLAAPRPAVLFVSERDPRLSSADLPSRPRWRYQHLRHEPALRPSPFAWPCLRPAAFRCRADRTGPDAFRSSHWSAHPSARALRPRHQ